MYVRCFFCTVFAVVVVSDNSSNEANARQPCVAYNFTNDAHRLESRKIFRKTHWLRRSGIVIV